MLPVRPCGVTYVQFVRTAPLPDPSPDFHSVLRSLLLTVKTEAKKPSSTLAFLVSFGISTPVTFTSGPTFSLSLLFVLHVIGESLLVVLDIPCQMQL